MKINNIDDIMKKIKEFALNPQYLTILCIDEFDNLFQNSVY